MTDAPKKDHKRAAQQGVNLNGTPGADVLVGTAFDDRINAFEGDDIVIAKAGDDYLDGGDGNDVLQGGKGGDDMYGGDGDDTYYIDSGEDSVTEFFDEGFDWIFENQSFFSMGANIEATTVLGEYQDLEDGGETRRVFGNELDNVVNGHDGPNRLYGFGGDDIVDGRAGNDDLFGGEGNDAMSGGDDAVRLEGHTVVLAPNSDFVSGGGGEDEIDGGAGDDELFGDSGDDFIYGGDDGLLGDRVGDGGEGGGTGETEDGKVFLTNNDLLDGGKGDDVLDGGSGDDRLFGGEGADELHGGAGGPFNEPDVGANGPLNTSNRDYLDGGTGIDYMAGGSDDDQYVVDGFFVETTAIPVYDDSGDPVPGAVTRVWTTDTVFENADEGYDRVFSYADFTLPEHVERLELAWFSEARIGRGNSGDNDIFGNNFDNLLEGGAGNDVIDGRKGYDRMSGGAGDDVYYVDETRGRVDLVTENPNAGYDTVYSSADYTLVANVEELHLIGREDLDGKGNSLANILVGNTGDNKLYGEAGNDLLLDDAGEDRLEGGAGDDVLDGGAEDDTLIGGAGNDLYVHTKGGGDDLVQDSGGTDAIRFGAGITASQVAVRRNSNDLVLRLSGGNGSMTVKDWFSSSAKRVEQVQFADGTVWNESAIRARVSMGGAGGSGGGSHQDHDSGYRDDGARFRGNGHDDDGHHDGRHDHKDHHGGRGTDEMRDAIAVRLGRNPNYDFTALAAYLQRQGGGGYGAMTPQQIASQWVQVQNSVSQLAHMDDDSHGGHGGHGGWGGGDDDRGHGGHGWGHHGSTGHNRGCGGMDTFAGLGEGFRRL